MLIEINAYLQNHSSNILDYKRSSDHDHTKCQRLKKKIKRQTSI